MFSNCLKLRTDDIQFVEDRIACLQLAEQHCNWMCTLITSSYPKETVCETIARLRSIAGTDECAHEYQCRIVEILRNNAAGAS
jgi:hypothetical protein